MKEEEEDGKMGVSRAKYAYATHTSQICKRIKVKNYECENEGNRQEKKMNENNCCTLLNEGLKICYIRFLY